MTDPKNIRTGLVNALKPITVAAKAAGVPGFQVVGYWLSSPTPPTIWVVPDKTEYLGNLDKWTWTIHAVVSLNLDESAQVILDRLLASSGDMSVKAAVEADTTLGGVVDDLNVVDAMGHQLFDIPTRGVFLGSTWTVEMLALGE